MAEDLKLCFAKVSPHSLVTIAHAHARVDGDRDHLEIRRVWSTHAVG
jgi:hypothetical protein